jgi:hypothetical protein
MITGPGVKLSGPAKAALAVRIVKRNTNDRSRCIGNFLE